MMTCEEVKLALGAHALGALDPEEAIEIDNHLATCDDCGAELVELEGVTSFLGKVSEHDVELVASPPRQVLDRLLNDRAKRTKRSRLLLTLAASAAAVAVGGTALVAVQTSADRSVSTATAPESAGSGAADSQVRPRADKAEQLDSPVPYIEASPTKSPANEVREFSDEGREFSGENKAEEYRATVSAWPGGDGGTDLGVRVSGIPVGTTCRLVVIGVNGERRPTKAWRLTRDTYQDKVVFRRSTSLPMPEIAEFEIVDPAGRVLVGVKVRD
ncbi:zf-HC2 domain-containing protein [Nonomuraea sp. NPDC046802]|uniref:anti-sigma factor family protein n=1 Tax=Nonomuraea sp. NPDC046802 TaxID=3154919 RepID=UPI0033E927CB